MKRVLGIATVVLLLGVFCAAVKGADVAPGAKLEQRVVRHVVLFAYKSGATPEQVKAVQDKFFDLKNKIDGIISIEGGPDISPEKMQQGFTHPFMVTFKSVAARDAYLPHPAHKEFGTFLGQYLDKVLVVDFESKI